jgi:hypothetical protein
VHKKNKFKSRILFEENKGVSNIVTSIMMLGIFLSILAMVFTIYLPEWAKSGEANHMEGVVDSFLDIKSNIDKQITDEKGIGSTISTPIKLGAEGGAIMGMGRTSGSLSYNPTGFNIILNNTYDVENVYGQSFGSLTYKSRNIYYTNQNLYYENGVVIIEQAGKAIMKARPNFDLMHADNKTTLVLSLIHLTGDYENLGGTDSHTMDTTLIQSTAQSREFIWSPEEGFGNGQNITINISTRFGPLWKEFIEEEINELTSDVINNTVDQLSLTTVKDPATGETRYNLILKLKRIHKLDAKKGIVEIKFN